MEFLLSKLATQLAYPLSVSLALGLLALGLLVARRRGLAAAALILSVALLWASSTRGVAFALGRSLEGQHPPLRVEDAPAAGAIVVLGGGLRMPAPPELWSDLGPDADRIVHAARLYRAGKAPRIVVSDGGMPWAPGEERPARGMAELLVEWGVPRDALLIEDRSRNTYENAVETRAVLAANGIRDILLVTSALHMPRALAVFRAQGISASPAATDYQTLGGSAPALLAWAPGVGNLSITHQALKEYLGIRVYRLRGWIDE